MEMQGTVCEGTVCEAASEILNITYVTFRLHVSESVTLNSQRLKLQYNYYYYRHHLIYSVVTIHGTYVVSFSVESIVLLH